MGDYGNFAQVWQDAGTEPSPVHWRLSVRSLGTLEGMLWLSLQQMPVQQQSGAADTWQVARLQALPDSSFRLDLAPWRGAAPATLPLAQVAAQARFAEGCEVPLQLSNGRLAGQTPRGRCLLQGAQGEVNLVKDVSLSAREVAFGERLLDGNGQQAGLDRVFRFQRLGRYSGFLGVRDDDGRWHVLPEPELNDDGGRWPVVGLDGRNSGHSLRLARVPWQEGQGDILRLDLLDDSTGRPVASAWTAAGGHNLGLQLEWMQVGLSRLPDSSPSNP